MIKTSFGSRITNRSEKEKNLLGIVELGGSLQKPNAKKKFTYFFNHLLSSIQFMNVLAVCVCVCAIITIAINKFIVSKSNSLVEHRNHCRCENKKLQDKINYFLTTSEANTISRTL